MENKKIIVFSDYQNKEYLLLSAEEGADIEKLLKAALADAEKDAVIVNASNVPEEYLERYGLHKEPLEILELENYRLGKTEMEQAGIECATCRCCSSFEEGICLRYGGTTNPDGEEDCVHGTNIYTLSYDNDIAKYLYIAQELSLNTIIEILENDSSVKDIIELEDYDEKLWKLEERE